MSFVWTDNYGFICTLLHVDIQFNQHNLLEMVCFFHSVSGFLIKRHQVSIGGWIYIWVFSSVPLINIFGFVQYHAVLISMVLEYDLKSDRVFLLTGLSLFRIVLAIFESLCSHKAENCPFKIYEELCWNLDRNCIESIDWLLLVGWPCLLY